MRENDLQKWLKDYYRNRDWVVIRVFSGKVQTIGGDWVVGADKGTPDLILINPEGQTFYTEVKTEKGKQSPDQKIWEARAKERGLTYVVIHNQIEAWQKLEGYQGKDLPF